MDKEQCYYLGHITKAHGQKGDVVAFFDVDDPSQYAQLDSVFVELDGTLVPFFIAHIKRVKQQNFRIRFEEVESAEHAAMLLKKNLFLPLELLPEKTGKHFYFHEVIGFAVNDQAKGAIGTVKAVMEHPTNPLLDVDWNGTQLLLPINDKVIVEVDRSARQLLVDAPEGLVDLYLGG